MSDAIHSTSRCQRAPTALERIDLGTNVVDGYEAHDEDNADRDEEEQASQADDGLMQTLED